MCGFLLPRIAAVLCKGVIESLAVDVLSVIRKMAANCRRQLEVLAIRHRFCSRGVSARQYAPSRGATGKTIRAGA